MVLLAVSTAVFGHQQFGLLGTDEQGKELRFQHVYDVRTGRTRLAGLTNLDWDGSRLTRYQLKPRFSYDFVQEKPYQLEFVYQKEWFWNEFQVQTRRGWVTREVRTDVDRIGVGMRNQTKHIRNELIVYVHDSDTGGQRIEDILTIRLPYRFTINNQYWRDFETDVTFNQVSLLYALDKHISLIVQNNTVTNRDNVIRAGVWVRF
jgi:hypothetical protein